MTKHFTILVLILFVGTTHTFSQTIELSLGFQPNQEIEQTSIQRNTQLMTFSGSKELMRQLAQAGMENPKLTETEVTSLSKIVTGELNEDEEYPVEMEFVERSDSAETDGMLIGTKFHGTCLTGELPEFDSVSGSTMEAEIETVVLDMMNNMMSQMDIPIETLSVGKTEKVKTPMNIPIAGMNIVMQMTVHYTLTEVKGDLAYIDIRTEMKMEMEGLPMEVDGKGAGDGKMIYSTSKKLVQDMEQTIEMKLDLDQKINGENLKIKMDQTTYVKVHSELVN